MAIHLGCYILFLLSEELPFKNQKGRHIYKLAAMLYGDIVTFTKTK